MPLNTHYNRQRQKNRLGFIISQKTKLQKVAAFLAITILFQAIFPPISLALTGGPTQPEVQGFQPVGASNMVDLFTGDFSYNIPLLDVDGYPINISYSSNPSMDAESSWVGLGWSLNPGAINRNLRGLPDDFKNETIEKEYNINEDKTVGVNGGFGFEFFGWFGLSASLGVFHNTYTGYGIEAGLAPSLILSKAISHETSEVGTEMKPDTSSAGLTLGIGLNYNSQSGLNVQPQIGLFHRMGKAFNRSVGINANYNSIRGLKSLTLNAANKDRVRSGRINANFTFGDFTYYPTSTMPLINEGFTFHGSAGGEVFGAHPGPNLNGYVTAQRLISKYKNQVAFGYLYAHEGQEIAASLQDFNRDKDVAFRQQNPVLPMTYGTYDIFSASGQGLSGQFRTMRNDVGLYREAQVSNISTTDDLGLELGFGNAFHAGIDVESALSVTSKGAWNDGNNMKPRMPFTESKGFYEASYFKSSGEKIITDINFYEQMGGANPINVELEKVGMSSKANSKFVVSKNLQKIEEKAVNNKLLRAKDQREKRNQVFSYLTAKEASSVGLEKMIENYTGGVAALNDCDASSIQSMDRVDATRKEHHISEVTITQADGSRYVYGIPVYNTLQREASFNIGSTVLSDTTLANYLAGDNSVANNKGKDGYFDAQNIPPYAHSYLLTAVLSPDYVDVTGDGISDDDIGNGVKLNYSRAFDTTTPYQWRSPYQANQGRFQEGSKAKQDDNKASYVYGEKEIWYLHSIESRTMTALFHVLGRNDSKGVAGENGGIGTQELKRLDKIELFSKSELIADASASSSQLAIDPLPIKTVHFGYNYDLCQGIPNGTTGKLTLDKIWFTYQNSNRGALNAYHFDYAMTNPNLSYGNPNYDIDDYDRWGCYQKIPQTGTSSNGNYPSYNNFPASSDFPYTLQDAALVNDFANAWNLTAIELPSGSKIQVEYESDDYAYVQNKRAGQMFFLEGFADTATGAVDANLYTMTNNGKEVDPKEYVVLKLVEPVASEAEFKKRYLEDVKQIYYHCLVDLNGEDRGQEDYIKGYLDFDENDITLKNGNTEVALRITDLPKNKKDNYHPITHATFQNIRLYYPEILFPGYSFDGDTEGLIRQLGGIGNELKNLFKGYHLNSAKKNWGQKVDLNKSWIRLASPSFKKLGGGARVKQIAISDEWGNWNAVPNDGNSTYGQQYAYETETTINGVRTVISSGVASYEPLLGNEENLMREAIPYSEQASKTVNNDFFVEQPIGEALFPSAVVGYSKVKVTPFGSYKSQSVQSVGYSLSSFYTAKDFPVRTDYARVNPPVKRKSSPLEKFFRINVKDHMAVSQGFVVELNDMHGKPKEEAIYDKNGSLLSSTHYRYQVEDPTAMEQQLVNEVDVVQKDGTVSQVNIGLEMDVWQDMREESNITETAGVKSNGDGFLAFIIPFIGAYPFPVYHKQTKILRSAVTTKLIKRIGLLDEVTVSENGSTVTTKNMLYDSETGNVLLTRTENEFNDYMYQLSYPAHWAYAGMEQSYQNIGAIFDNIDINNGHIQGAFDYEGFQSGDELFIEKQTASGTYEALPKKYTLVKTGATSYSIMDNEGQVLEPTGAIDDTYRFKIVRSGKRNQAAYPIASIATRQAPLNNTATALEINTAKQILETSSTEFSDIWKIPCDFSYQCDEGGLLSGIFNPYAKGAFGVWRPQKSWVYHSQRSPNLAAAAAPVQTSGTYFDFTPFWSNTGTDWQPLSPPNTGAWVQANEMTAYDPRGNELENKDAIGNSSAAIFGYQNTRAVAIASNAKRQEILYDGFEDYSFDNHCDENGIINLPWYINNQGQVTEGLAHTGKYALSINTQGRMEVEAAIEDCSIYVVSGIADNIPLENAWTDGTYISNKCNTCLTPFKLTPGESYFINLWVATPTSIDCGLPPSKATAAAYFDVETDLFALQASGPVIDGWQRMAGTFTVPSSATRFHLGIRNNESTSLLVDDFRIHPQNSNMVSYVYDPQNLRLMAQLDDNNYASFYEYDDEGILIRTKRETENGIVTIQEARTVLKPNN